MGMVPTKGKSQQWSNALEAFNLTGKNQKFNITVTETCWDVTSEGGYEKEFTYSLNWKGEKGSFKFSQVPRQRQPHKFNTIFQLASDGGVSDKVDPGNVHLKMAGQVAGNYFALDFELKRDFDQVLMHVHVHRCASMCIHVHPLTYTACASYCMCAGRGCAHPDRLQLQGRRDQAHA